MVVLNWENMEYHGNPFIILLDENSESDEEA